VQATGRDARSRKQYRRHSAFRLYQEEAKFELLLPFGQALPTLRRTVERDLGRRTMSRERVAALVATTIDASSTHRHCVFRNTEKRATLAAPRNRRPTLAFGIRGWPRRCLGKSDI
jgi:hypothetical protein